MAIAYNTVFTAINDEGTVITVPYDPGTTIRGIVVLVSSMESATPTLTSITYGGVALDPVEMATDAIGEPMRTWGYFLGDSIPAGANDVVITASATISARGFIASFTAADDTEVVDSGVMETTNQADPQVTLDSGTRDSARVLGVASGIGNVPNLTPFADQTSIFTDDLGAIVYVSTRRTAIEDGSIAVGYTAAGDDVAVVGIAIAEVVGGPDPITGTGAFTEDPDVVAGSGTFTPAPVTGTGDLAEDPDTVAASGVYTPPPITGTGEVTEDPDSVSGAGETAQFQGSGAITEDPDVAAGAGTFTPAPVTGTGAFTEDPDVVSGSGVYTPPPITGTGAVDEDGDVVAGEGEFAPSEITGTGALLEDPDTAAGSGTFAPAPITGTGAFTEDPDVVAGVGIGFEVPHPPGPAKAPLIGTGLGDVDTTPTALGASLTRTGASGVVLASSGGGSSIEESETGA